MASRTISALNWFETCCILPFFSVSRTSSCPTIPLRSPRLDDSPQHGRQGNNVHPASRNQLTYEVIDELTEKRFHHPVEVSSKNYSPNSSTIISNGTVLNISLGGTRGTTSSLMVAWRIRYNAGSRKLNPAAKAAASRVIVQNGISFGTDMTLRANQSEEALGHQDGCPPWWRQDREIGAANFRDTCRSPQAGRG